MACTCSSQARREIPSAAPRPLWSVWSHQREALSAQPLQPQSQVVELRSAGIGDPHLFPLPGLRAPHSTVGGCSRGGAIICLVDSMVAVLNYLHAGSSELVPPARPPTAAQRRAHQRLRAFASAFTAAGTLATEKKLRDFVRFDFAYQKAGHVLPLGTRAGVPPVAADVTLAAAIRELYPEEARQLEEPQTLLLRPSERPARLKRPFIRTDATYPALVRQAVAAGLQDLRPEGGLARHTGAQIVSGAFAVAKDDVEDRTISSLVMNDLLDGTKIPRPRFAYIPMLRSVRVGRRPGMVLRVTKRDARHYFHRLAVGPRWRKYIGHPPVWDSTARQWLYPRHCAVPMGMRASAGGDDARRPLRRAPSPSRPSASVNVACVGIDR